jgi:drug/metabolite transporter (DMT)-like permease
MAASAAVLVASTAVILIGATQKELSASPMALLYAQNPYVIVYSILAALTFEDASIATALAFSNWHTAGLIGATGILSVAVNASGFLTIKLLSPLTYQVTSHLKPVLTLLLGVAAFGESVSALQACGFTLSIAGIAAYAAVRAQEQTSAAPIGLAEVTQAAHKGVAAAHTAATAPLLLDSNAPA